MKREFAKVFGVVCVLMLGFVSGASAGAAPAEPEGEVRELSTRGRAVAPGEVPTTSDILRAAIHGEPITEELALELERIAGQLERLETVQREAIDGYLGGESARAIQTANHTMFPYGPETTVLLHCSPLRVCTVSLVPGETPTFVTVADADRWWIPEGPLPDSLPMVGGDTYVIPFRPRAYNLGTNLVVGTDQGRIYTIELKSPTEEQVKKAPMYDSASFYDPKAWGFRMAKLNRMMEGDRDRQAEAAARAAAAADRPSLEDLGGLRLTTPIHELDFDYKIRGARVGWKPLEVFDDGTRTYLRFDKAAKRRELPSVLIKEGKEYATIVPQVEGDYYIVPMLFDEARLVLGSGRKAEKVVVTRRGS